MQPLSNVRVVDLTHVIAGPFCTYQLAVMGADVIKVEPPGNPDMSRMDGGNTEDCKRGMGSMFQTQSANKRAIAIDFRKEEGRKIVLKLIETADVLVENYRPGALDNLGLGYDAVKNIKPDLIYCSLTGFGQTGPLAERTAYDNVIQAMSGLMASTGDIDNAPIKVGPPVLDYGTGIQGAFAIAAALYQRTFSGKGQRIDIAMLDAAIMLSSTNFTHLTSAGEMLRPSGNSSTYNPGYGCYDTEDGLLVIGAWTSVQLENMWQVFGEKEIAKRVRKLRPWEYAEYFEADRKRLSEIAKTATADEWEQRLNDVKVPAARVRNTKEAAEHPQLKNRGVFQPVTLDGNRHDFPTAAFTFQEDGPALNNPPPTFAQHTQDILEELGYEKTNIQKLEEIGAIATASPAANFN